MSKEARQSLRGDSNEARRIIAEKISAMAFGTSQAFADIAVKKALLSR